MERKKYLCQTFGGLKHISGMCIKPNIFNPFLILVQTFGWCKHIKNSQTSILEEKKFQWAFRIILGPPKHVLHLVWSCLDTYLALKTTLKVSLYSYLNQANSGQIMTINTGNLFVFEVGPSVKFVSAIIDAIFNKKN